MKIKHAKLYIRANKTYQPLQNANIRLQRIYALRASSFGIIHNATLYLSGIATTKKHPQKQRRFSRTFDHSFS